MNTPENGYGIIFVKLEETMQEHGYLYGSPVDFEGQDSSLEELREFAEALQEDSMVHSVTFT